MLQPLHAILTLKPFSTGEETFFGWLLPVILLQNVMVSPGIDLVRVPVDNQWVLVLRKNWVQIEHDQAYM